LIIAHYTEKGVNNETLGKWLLSYMKIEDPSKRKCYIENIVIFTEMYGSLCKVFSEDREKVSCKY
jgi:hypothetical protein